MVIGWWLVRVGGKEIVARVTWDNDFYTAWEIEDKVRRKFNGCERVSSDYAAYAGYGIKKYYCDKDTIGLFEMTQEETAILEDIRKLQDKVRNLFEQGHEGGVWMESAAKDLRNAADNFEWACEVRGIRMNEQYNRYTI